MDFEYEIHPGERLIVERFFGEYNLDAVMESMKELESDPHFDPAFDGLVDLRQATMKISFNDMVLLNEYNERRNMRASGRWAFITGKPVNEGTFRMYEQVGGSQHGGISSFDTEEGARAWLKNGVKLG